MNREKLLTISVIALLLLNFTTLGFIFFQRPPHPSGMSPRQLDHQIISKLSLNTEQQERFETLKKAHHEQMLNSDHIYRTALENYFALLKNDVVAPAQQDSLQQVLSRIQQQRAKLTFRHFEELKAMCTPEQRRHFQELLPLLMTVILPHRPDLPGIEKEKL